MPIRPEQNPKPFVKGQSGNPKGRPKGLKNTATIIKEVLSAVVQNETLDGKKLNSKTTVHELLIKRMTHKALNKLDIKFVQEILNRLEGRPTLIVQQQDESNNITPHYSKEFENL